VVSLPFNDASRLLGRLFGGRAPVPVPAHEEPATDAQPVAGE
jgi:hypothetical protein